MRLGLHAAIFLREFGGASLAAPGVPAGRRPASNEAGRPAGARRGPFGQRKRAPSALPYPRAGAKVPVRGGAPARVSPQAKAAPARWRGNERCSRHRA